MLAVLKSATEDFQEYVNARDAKESYYSMKQKNGSSKKILIHSFVSKVSVSVWLQPDYLRKGLVRWRGAL
jgi:hypothetical protein